MRVKLAAKDRQNIFSKFKLKACKYFAFILDIRPFFESLLSRGRVG
jgi:hypothetical protein